MGVRIPLNLGTNLARYVAIPTIRNTPARSSHISLRTQAEQRSCESCCEPQVGFGAMSTTLWRACEFSRCQWNTEEGRLVPITLTSTRRRWSQIEREAYAIAFTVERLRVFLCAAVFQQVVTDHKPLVTLLLKPNVKLSARLE